MNTIRNASDTSFLAEDESELLTAQNTEWEKLRTWLKINPNKTMSRLFVK